MPPVTPPAPLLPHGAAPPVERKEQPMRQEPRIEMTPNLARLEPLRIAAAENFRLWKLESDLSPAAAAALTRADKHLSDAIRKIAGVFGSNPMFSWWNHGLGKDFDRLRRSWVAGGGRCGEAEIARLEAAIGAQVELLGSKDDDPEITSIKDLLGACIGELKGSWPAAAKR